MSLTRRFLLLSLSLCVVAGCESSSTRDSDRQFPELNASTDLGRFVADREPWTFRGDRGRAFYTPNSIIRTTTTDPKLIERLPPFVELSILHYQRAITKLPRPKETIETYFFDHRLQWESLTRSLMKEKADIYLAIERGGYSAKHIGVFYDIGPKDSFIICAHEGWHQYSHSTFAEPMPVWLDEGIACYMEGFRWDDQFPDHPRFMPWANLERFDQLRDAYNAGNLMTLHDLVTLRPQDLIAHSPSTSAALNYYAQVWALIHFLNEGEDGIYHNALTRLLQDASNGTFRESLSSPTLREFNRKRTGAGTLMEYLPEDLSLQTLDAQYQAFVARIVRVGARNKVLMGESPAL